MLSFQVNKRQVEILKDDEFISDDWSTVVVGDVLKVNIDEAFPADLVFLSSSDPQGKTTKNYFQFARNYNLLKA